MNGAERIAAERQRQMELEGWTPEHDDEHGDGDLLLAALCYANEATFAVCESASSAGDPPVLPHRWPWQADWWKPSDDPIRNLVKAGALVAAEIDRLQRRG